MKKYLIMILSLILGACAGKTIKVMHHQGSLFSNTADFLRSHTEIQARMSFPLSEKFEQWKLVKQVLDNLTQYSNQYSAVVVESPMINAFAAPNKRFYVTTGLLSLISTEDELAAVMAHELSHIELKHYEDFIDDFRALQIFDIFNVYSKDREYAADRNALQFLKKSRYQPQAMISFFKKMNASDERNDSKNNHWFLSHPSTKDRIKSYIDELKKNNLSEIHIAQESSVLFMKMKELMQEESQDYYTRGIYSYEPPRFKTGKKELDQKLEKLHKLMVQNQDLEFVAQEMEKLKNQNSIELNSAISLMLTRIYFFQGDYQKTDKEYKKANPNIFISTMWWPIRLKIVQDSKVEASKDLEVFLDSEFCQKHIECLREGAEIAYDYYFDEEISYLALQKFLTKLNQEKNNEEKKYSTISAGSLAIRSVVENLKEGSGTEINYLSDDIPKSQALIDLIEYEKNIYKNNSSWNSARKSWYFGLAVPYSASLKSDVSISSGAILDLGYYRNRWETGIFSSSYRHNPTNSSYTTSYDSSYFRLITGGIYVGYHFNDQLKYKYAKLKLMSSEALYNNYSNKASFSVSSGTGLGLEFGWNFPFGDGHIYGSWLRFGFEYQAHSLRPYWGTDGSTSFYGINFEIRFSGSYNNPTIRDLYKKPAVFF